MKRLLHLALAFSLIACSEASDKLTIDGNQFVGSDYTLTIPEDWVIKEDFMGSDLIATNAEMADSPQFSDGIAVTLENLPESISEEEYVELSTKLLQDVMGAEVSETEPYELNGVDATRFRYQMTMGNRTLDNDAILILQEDAAYIITLTTQAGEGRDARIEPLLEVAKTFEFQ